MRTLFAGLLLVTAIGNVAAAPDLAGSWEAARKPDDERIFVVLKAMGRAEIVEEYDFALPGQPKRRGRSVSYGKWAVKGNDVVLTYGKIQDRLRYISNEPLSAVGLNGTAPALKMLGKADTQSKIGDTTLYKGPHDYRVKASESAANIPAAPTAPAAEGAAK